MKSENPEAKIPTEAELVEELKEYDKDGNGEIDKEEMKLYVKKTLGLL